MKKVYPDCRFYDNESKGYMWAWSEWAKDKAIAAAVLAERKRIYAGLIPLHGIVRDEYLRSLCFPDGEPNPKSVPDREHSSDIPAQQP